MNLASRLEGQTKSYGVQILVGSRTAEALRDKFPLLELDRVTVKGKSEPETVYTVCGRADVMSSDDFKSLQAAVEQMLRCYRVQDWDGAERAVLQLRGCAGVIDTGELANLYLERIEAFRVNPPPPDWDGVFALTTK